MFEPKKILMGKKGQLQQIAFFLILIFSVTFTLLISKLVLSEFNDALEEDDIHTAESRQSITDMGVAFPTFDNMILVVLILLAIGLIITSFLIPTHPIFMVINVFGIFFLCFLGMILSNLYADIIANSPDLAAVYTSFPKLTFVMNQLPWIAAILVFLITIIQYSRYKNV